MSAALRSSKPTGGRNVISFIVPAVPVAQPRARATSIGGHARMYEAANAHPIHAFKASVRMAWSALRQPSIDGPIGCSLVFVLPRPKSVPKRKGIGRLPAAAKRGDVDNLLKGVLDALNELAFADDSQVCDAHVQKFVAAVNEQPHVEVGLWQLTAEAV